MFCFPYQIINANTFMHNVEKWPNVLWQSYGENTARFLKCVWLVFNSM